MKKTLVKILMVMIAIVLFIHSSIYAVSSEVNSLKKEQDKIDNQIDEAMEKQKELEAQKSQTMKAVENLIGKISESESEIDTLETKINDLRARIKSKEKDIEQKTQEYNEQEKLLDARVIAMYETGETSYLDVLLTATSMTDFLSKYYYASELVEYDKKIIEETKQQKIDIENEKAELETNKKDLDTSLAQSEQKNIQLKSLKKDKEKQAEKLTAEEKEIQKQIEELEAANRKIANDIKQAEIRYQRQLEELNRKNQGNAVAGSGYFIRPVASGSVTARAYYSSGSFHGAIDYGVSSGTTVKAAADGVVMYTASLSTSYGTHVVIRHANGLQTYYAHGTPGSICVKAGDTVKQGDKIMASGNSGHSSGPHLHFEVRKSPYNYSYGARSYGQDSRVNPENYL